MPRVTQTGPLSGLGISDALEWVHGDTALFVGIWETDEAVPVPVDLTGAVITLTFEWYLATVRVAVSRGEDAVDVTDLAEDPAPDVVIAAVVDPDQVANRGVHSWTLPADVYRRNPAADISERVPVAIVYLTREIGAQTLTNRSLLILRRGKP